MSADSDLGNAVKISECLLFYSLIPPIESLSNGEPNIWIFRNHRSNRIPIGSLLLYWPSGGETSDLRIWGFLVVIYLIEHVSSWIGS